MSATVRLAGGDAEVSQVLAVRREVFVVEQEVPVELEMDGQDATADHFVLYDDEAGLVVGAGRLVVEPAGFAGIEASFGLVGHLGRLAVRRSARGTGLGVLLVRAIEDRARQRSLRVMALGAQTYAIGFYERLGYTAFGLEFDDAGLPHRWMSAPL